MKILTFTSSDCRACRSVKEALKALAHRHKLNIVDYPIEQGVEPFSTWGVSGTPVVIVIGDDGREVGRFMGHQTETSMENSLIKIGVIPKE